MNAYLPPQPVKPPVRKRRAQAMLEFVLVLPILLLILFGVIEFGRLFYAWIIIENAARAGVRYASTGNFDQAHCLVDLNLNGSLCDRNKHDELEIDAARTPTIKDEARASLFGLTFNEGITQADQGFLKVTVCSATPTNNSNPRVFTPPQMGLPENTQYSDCQPGEDPGLPGQRVVVSVDYNFTFLVLPIFGFQPDMHLASYREGTVEQFRISRTVNTPIPILYPTPIPPTATTTYTTTPTETPGPTSTPTITRTPTNTYTPTNTPTNTSTPTATPTPNCANISITSAWTKNKNFNVTIQNDNAAPANLKNGILTWSGSNLFDKAQFAGTQYFDANPDRPSPSYTIPAPASVMTLDGNGATATWTAVFTNNTSSGVVYGITLYFEYPGWGTCPVTDNTMATETPTPTASNTPTITRTPSKTPTASNTPTASRTPTITPTPSKTPTPTITPTPSRTPTPTITPTPSKTPTRTPTPTITPTPSRTPTRTITPTPSKTPTPTNTPTPSRTPTPTSTRTPTKTPTASNTPTKTLTPTKTPTPSDTPTRTPTRTKTPTPASTNTTTPTTTPTFCQDC